MTVSIIGCGWLGMPLGESLVQSGWLVKGSTTTKAKLSFIEGKGILPYLLHVKEELEGNFEGLFDCDIIVINIPPGHRNPNVIKEYPLLIRLIIDEIKSKGLKHVILISSTGVYQNTGQIIDEDGPCIPTRSSGQALLRAESVVRASGTKWTILRLAGLVGKDRQPGKWFAGRTDIPGGQSPVNMIHQFDAISAIIKVIDSNPTRHIYNLCADCHPVKKEFYKTQAEKIGLSPPSFTDEISAFKIVDNSKFKLEFGFNYSYPNPSLF